MATIKKTTEGGIERIITKSSGVIQKISCSCCEEVCCMYSAQKYIEGVYLREDLPETLTIYGQADAPYTINFELNLFGQDIYTGDGNTKIQIINESWEILGEDGNPAQDRSPSDCLVYEPFFEGGAYNGDNYEDTYLVEVKTTPLPSPTIETFEITRTSLCTWEGFGFGYDFTLKYYDTIELVNERHTMWGFEYSAGNAFRDPLDAPFNSPVGTYAEASFAYIVKEI
jgi:hypothetical protein